MVEDLTMFQNPVRHLSRATTHESVTIRRAKEQSTHCKYKRVRSTDIYGIELLHKDLHKTNLNQLSSLNTIHSARTCRPLYNPT